MLYMHTQELYSQTMDGFPLCLMETLVRQAYEDLMKSLWIGIFACSGFDQKFFSTLIFSVERDVNDFYITANAATYHTVWRVREVDEFIDDLYKSPSMPNYTFQGLVDNYTTF